MSKTRYYSNIKRINSIIMTSQASLYSKFSSLQFKDNHYLLKKYRHLINLPSKEISVVDVGCGDGTSTVKYLVAMIPKLKNLIGIDVSASMVDYAKRKNAHDKVEYVKCDISSQNFSDCCFDYTFSLFCLQWVGDHRTAFKNIYNGLKHEGGLFAPFVLKNPLSVGARELSKRSRWQQYNHEKLWPANKYETNPKEELGEILSETGFINIGCYLEDMTYTFPNSESFDGFASAVNPVIYEIPTEDREDYVRDYLHFCRTSPDITIVKTDDKEGEITMKYKYIIAIATKKL